MKFNEEELYHFSNHEQTPLNYASRNGYINITEYLIKKGADINAKDRIK